MNILMVSDFLYSKNSGAAGSIIKIGEELTELNCKVYYIWAENKRYIHQYNLFRFTELPFIQYKQIKDFLKSNEKIDVVIVSQPFVGNTFSKLRKEFPHILFINRTHGWEHRIESWMWEQEKHGGLKRQVKNFITRKFLEYHSFFTLKYSDAVICASSSDADYIRKYYPKYSDKVKLIKYGIEKDFQGLSIPPKTDDKVKFLFVGQYVERKGVKDLCTIFKEVAARRQDFSFTLVINADAIGKAEEDFKFLSKDCINIISWKKREELIKLYSEHDVFLMPSYGEGFGKTTLEAMACGLAVIGYNEGALKDFGIDNKTAMIVEPGDVEQLKMKIIQTFESKEVVKNIGNAAYWSVQSSTWKQNAENTITCFSELLKK